LELVEMPFCLSSVWPHHSELEELILTDLLIQYLRHYHFVGHFFCGWAVLKKIQELSARSVNQMAATAGMKSKTSSKSQL
jgi:hypothetical protein